MFKAWIKKNIAALLTALFGLGLLCFVFIPRSSRQILASVPVNGNMGELCDTVVLEEEVDTSGAFDYFGIQVATYARQLSQGTLRMELYDSDGNLAASKRFARRALADNSYIWLPVSKGESGHYRLKVYVEGFTSGKAPTLYASEACSCTKNGIPEDVGVAFVTARSVRTHSIGGILLCSFFFLMGILRQSKKITVRRYRYAAVICSLVLLLPIAALAVSAYELTGRFNPSVIIKLSFDPMGNCAEQTFSNADGFAVFYDFSRPDGSVYSRIHSYTMDPEALNIYSLTVRYQADIEKRSYDTSLFRYREDHVKKALSARLIFRGQAEDTLFFDGVAWEKLQFDYGETSSFDDLRIAGNKHGVVKEFVVNDSAILKDLKHRIAAVVSRNLMIVFLIAALFALLAYKRIPAGLLRLEDRAKLREEMRFLFLAFLMGLVFSCFLPLFQAPDEGAHLKMISEELGYSNLERALEIRLGAEVMEKSGETIPWEKYRAAMALPMQEHPERTALPSYHVIRHFPQAFAMELALLANLSPFWVLMAGRLGGLLFYLVIGFFTIHLLPHKKTMMMALLCSPMCLQQAASLSYDCVILSLCPFTIAYILCLRETGQSFGWRELLFLILMLAPAVATKMNCALLAFLVFLIPFDQWRFPFGLFSVDGHFLRKHRWPVLFCAIVLMAAGLYALSRTLIGKLLFASLLSPREFGRLMYFTVREKTEFFLASTTARFGWLDTYAPNYLCFLILGVWFLSSRMDTTADGAMTSDSISVRGTVSRWRKNAVLLILFFAGILSCFVAMEAWSFALQHIEVEESIGGIRRQLSEIRMIEGVQGRYFLPFLSLLFLPIRPRKPAYTDWCRFLLTLAQLYILVIVFLILRNRYWSF